MCSLITHATDFSYPVLQFPLYFQVRHPNILSFLHSTEVETLDGSTTKVTIYIVTEPVMPLSEKLKELGLVGTQRYYFLYLYFDYLLGLTKLDLIAFELLLFQYMIFAIQ